MTRLLIVADDEIGPVMSGPGMRFRAFAEDLAASVAVTMAVPHAVTWQPDRWQLAPYTRYGDELADLVETHDVILCKGLAPYHFPALARPDRIVIYDLYDPFIFENIEAHLNDDRGEAAYMYRFNLDLTLAQLQRGDFFLCANERQRDLWIGMLAAIGRVNHATYRDDKTLRRLVAVVPFGMTAEPPQATVPAIKGVWSGVAATDKVLLWGGGVWSWLDPETALQGMALLADTRPDVKLCFLGRARPSASWYYDATSFERLDDAVATRAQQLGLLGRNVFFNERWVPLDERAAYLLDADVGVITHPLSMETHYAARTRALDYLWAGLPILTTEGDTVAEWVERYQLGATIRANDPADFVRGVLAALACVRTEVATRMQPLASRLVWPQAIAPLHAFCAAPHTALDRGSPEAEQLERSFEASALHRDTVIRDLEAAVRGRDDEITERKAWLAHLEANLTSLETAMTEGIAYRDQVIVERDNEIAERKAWLEQLQAGIDYRDQKLQEATSELAKRTTERDWQQEALARQTQEIAALRQRITILEARFGWADGAINRAQRLLKKEGEQ